MCMHQNAPEGLCRMAWALLLSALTKCIINSFILEIAIRSSIMILLAQEVNANKKIFNLLLKHTFNITWTISATLELPSCVDAKERKNQRTNRNAQGSQLNIFLNLCLSYFIMPWASALCFIIFPSRTACFVINSIFSVLCFFTPSRKDNANVPCR